jgi:catechol 2,3-dioxygenase-like lactoylglutathione lyase family enzyme
MTAAQALAQLLCTDAAPGFEVLIPRMIEPREIRVVRRLPQTVGWRYFPEVHGTKPCGCPACQLRGEIRSRRIRLAWGRSDRRSPAAHVMEATMTAPHSLRELVLGTAIMLAVRDLDASLQFYRDTLGFDVLSPEPHIAAVRLGAFQLYLFTHSPPTVDKPSVTLTNLNTPAATAGIVNLIVADCQAAHDLLVQRGVTFLTPPHAPPWGGLRCFARDPDGYLIELEEHPHSPFLTHRAASGNDPGTP